MPRSLSLLGASALALAPALVAAQDIQLPLGNSSIAPPAQTPAAVPTPVPSPVVTPAPAPTATPEPTPIADATPDGALAAPTDRPAPRRDTGEAPRVAATPGADATPTPGPTPAFSTAPIETVVLPQQPRGAASLWPWLAGGAALLLVLARLLVRRRGAREEEDVEEYAEPEPKPEPPAPPPPATPARLAIALRPTRAGVNLLTATVESEVVVANTGGRPATDIRAVVALTGAAGGEEAVIERLAAQPIAKPDAPPFALAPGEERRFRAVAAVPLDAIPPFSAAGRPLFVPLAVATMAWRDGAASRRTTQGFAVGVTRDDSAKLGPLWLDLPPRSYDAVAARPHGAALETT